MISVSERRRLVLAALLVALGRPVAAQPAGDESELDSHTRTAARALAAQGSAAFEAQRYGEALDLFDRAAALVAAPTITLMQARTLVQLGRWVEGADKYASIQRWRDAQPPDSTPNPTFALAAQSASQELAHLMPRIPRLNVSVGVSRQGEEVEVLVDERKLPSALVGVDVPVDPGPHSVEVRRPGGEPIVRHVTLGEGGREEMTILVDAEPAPASLVAVAAPPVPLERSAPDSSGASSRQTLGWLVLGTGAAATAVGTVTGIVALGKKSELDDACHPGCPPSSAETIDSYRSNRTISYVSFAVGVAALGGGAYLLLSGPEENPELALGVNPSGAKLWGRF